MNRTKHGRYGSGLAPFTPPHTISRALLAWYRRAGRHDLPWKTPRDPYRVWISEIMLQQTRVTTAIPYFERFMAAFPTMEALAAAPAERVLHLWAGLGYYARARNLHRAARVITEAYGGKLPEDPATLQTLPGIGPSTAGAIAALAFERRAPILDGNVKRVLARLHGVRAWPGERDVERDLWALAEVYTPEQRVAEYTQAIMDLGATLCTRKAPACERCPLAGWCVAHRDGLTEVVPAPRPRRALPQRTAWVLLLTDAGGRLLLARRRAPGLWGGMWSFPELPGDVADDSGGDSGNGDAARTAARELLGGGARVRRRGCWPPLHHTFTHFRLTLTPVHVQAAAHTPTPAWPPDTSLEGVADHDDAEPGLRWIDPRDPPDIALAAPVRRLLPGFARHDLAGGAGTT